MISIAILQRFNDCHIDCKDTKLHSDAYSGDLKGLKETLSSLSNKAAQTLLDKKNHHGCTALRLAASNGNSNCVEYLLEAGASVDISDVKGQTPLLVAAKNKHLKCVKHLLQYGARPDGDVENVSTPLFSAAMNGYDDILQVLIEYGANLSSTRVNRIFANDPIRVALAYHKYQCCRKLLLAGYSDTSSCYHVAVCQKCDVSFLQLLYDFGISLYTHHNGVYPWQIKDKEHRESVRYLNSLKDNPRSLLSLCRLTIRSNMKDLFKIHELQLPVTLVKYLNHQ